MSEQISLKEIDGMLENQQVDNQADSNVTEETPNETVTFSLADIDAMLDEGEKKPDFAAAKKASDALNGTGSVAKQPTAKTEQKVEQKNAEQQEQTQAQDKSGVIQAGESTTLYDPKAGMPVMAAQGKEGKRNPVIIVEHPNTYLESEIEGEEGKMVEINPRTGDMDENGNTIGGYTRTRYILPATEEVKSQSREGGLLIGTLPGTELKAIKVGWKFPGSNASKLANTQLYDNVGEFTDIFTQEAERLNGMDADQVVKEHNELAESLRAGSTYPSPGEYERLAAMGMYVHARDLGYNNLKEYLANPQDREYREAVYGSGEMRKIYENVEQNRGNGFDVGLFTNQARLNVQNSGMMADYDIAKAIGNLYTDDDKKMAYATALYKYRRNVVDNIDEEYRRLLGEPIKATFEEIEKEINDTVGESTLLYSALKVADENQLSNIAHWVISKVIGADSDGVGYRDIMRTSLEKESYNYRGWYNSVLDGITFVENALPAYGAGKVASLVMKLFGGGTASRIFASTLMGRMAQGAASGVINLPAYTYFNGILERFHDSHSSLGDVLGGFTDWNNIKAASGEAPTGALLGSMALFFGRLGRAVSGGKKTVEKGASWFGEGLAFSGSSSIKKWMEINERQKKGEDVSFSVDDVIDCTLESIGMMASMKLGNYAVGKVSGRENMLKNAKGERLETEDRTKSALQFESMGMNEIGEFLKNPRKYAKEHGITNETDMDQTALGKQYKEFLTQYQKGGVTGVDANAVGTAMWLIQGKAMMKPISYGSEIAEATGKDNKKEYVVYSLDELGNRIESRSFKNREKAEKWQEELRYDAEKYNMTKLEAIAEQRESEKITQKTFDTMFDEIANSIPSRLPNGEPDPKYVVPTRMDIANIIQNTMVAEMMLQNVRGIPIEEATKLREMVRHGRPFVDRYKQLMAENRAEAEAKRIPENEAMFREQAQKILDKKPNKRSAEENEFLQGYSEMLRASGEVKPYVGVATLNGQQVYVKNQPESGGDVYYEAGDGSVQVQPAIMFTDFRPMDAHLDPRREFLEQQSNLNREELKAIGQQLEAEETAKRHNRQQEIEEKKKNAPVIDVQQPAQPEPEVEGSETPSPSTETLQAPQAETPEPPKEEKSEALPERKIEEPKTEEEHRKVIDEEQKWLDEHQEADPAEREQHRQRKWASERALGLRDENNNEIVPPPIPEAVEQSPRSATANDGVEKGEPLNESETQSPTAQTERKPEEITPVTEETTGKADAGVTGRALTGEREGLMEITNEDLLNTTTLTEEDIADPEAGALKRAARRNAERQRDDAIAYSRGEIKDKPENFDYWKERLGLEEPKAENAMQPVENAQPQKRKRGGFFKMGEKKEQEPIQSPSVQDKFEEEKKKFEAEAERNKRNEYASVLAASNSAEEAIAEWRSRAVRAREEAEDWRNRKYKSNNSVVTGVNRYSSADEYETTIGAANERRRRSAIRALEEAAKEYEGFIETLKSRTGYKEESTKKSETMSPSTETAQGNGQGELAFGEETPEQREAREKQERVDKAASLRSRHTQLSEEIKQKQLEYRYMNDRKKQYQARQELNKLYDEIESVEQQLKETGEPMQVKRFNRPAKKERTQHAARKAYDEMRKKYKDDSEVMEILDDTEPQDIYEQIGIALGSSKLLFKSKGEGASRKRGVADETGWKWNDVKGMFQLFDNEKGQSVSEWAETFWADLDEGAKNRYSDSDIKHMMLDVLGGASTIGDLRNIVLANRVRQAEELLEHREKEEEYWRDMERHEQEMRETEEEAMIENIKDLAENFDEQEYYSKFADEILKAQRDDSTGSNRDLPQGERGGFGNEERNGETGERETAGNRDNKDNASIEVRPGETGADSQENGRESRGLDSQRVSQERAGLSAKEREIVNRVNAGINEAIDDLNAEIRGLEKKGDEEGAEAVRLEKEMLENSREDMIDDALAEYDDLQKFKNGTRAERNAAERREKSLADRKAKRMRELLEKLRDPNTSDVRRRAVVRQLADLGVDASGFLEGRNEIKEIEEVDDEVETPVEGVHESKGRVELNAATLKDPVSREYLEQRMEDEGWSEEARKQFMQTLDDAAEVVLEMGKRYKRLGDWNKMEILSETDEVDYNPRWRLMNRKGQWIPNRSAFKKNGEYPWNIDLGTLCTKRESFDALVQLIAEKGMAQNLGPTQIEAIKELLKDNDFLTACDICFNETKRARVISYANQISNNWRVVSEAIGVKDKMVGDPIALTQEQRNTLHRMAGRGYKSAFQELIPESERRQYKGEEKSGNEIDLGITASMMQRIAKQMLIDPTLVGKLKPETLITTEGMDWFLRTYGGHTDVNGILASAWGSGTPKPIEGFNLYDPLSWRDDYDQKKENPRWHEGLKSRPSINWLMNNGGFRAQSFTDYHPMLFLDYLQMFTDVGVRKLPMHIYTKVPALVKLFGGSGAKINMSLVPKMEDGVDAEHAGLKPDGKGGWEYAWDNDSFPIEEAFSLRQDPRFRGNVGIIAVGLSDAHILKMLDDPTIDQIIPYHKSGMPESVQIKTGLKNATDYTEQQTTGGKPKKAADFNFNEAVRRTGDPRKAASEYVKWCEMNGYTPKFDQFKDHPNYYKVLADFRLFDNEGKYSEQEAVNPGKILGDNWKQELEDSLNDKTMQEAVKARVAGNEKLMKDVERLMSKQRMDGAVRDEMVKKLKGALGKDNVESLKQNEFFNALEDAYKQTMGAEQAKAKVEVLRTTNGVVYGFASGGKITLNENVFNAETPIHEFTHIWVKVAQRENAKLWKKGKDLLKQTGEWQEVMNDDLYADIRGDEDAVASEVLARIVGSEGADYVRRLLDPEHKPLKQGGVYNQIKEWLREMFNNVRSLFAPSIRNLTYDEFVNMPLKTLFDEAEAKRFLEAKTRLESEGGLEGDVEDMRGWHGSGADFDAFDLGYALTGEGSMVYGHGAYITGVKGIGESYAEQGRRKFDGKFTYKGKDVDNWKSNGLFDESDPSGYDKVRFLEKVAEAQQRDYRNGTDVEVGLVMDNYYDNIGKRRKYLDDRLSELLEKTQYTAQEVLGYEPPKTPEYMRDMREIEHVEKELEKLTGLETFIKEFKEKDLSTNFDETRPAYLYEVDFPDNDGTNYVSWNKTLPKDHRRRVADVVRGLPDDLLQRDVHGPNWLRGGFEQLANTIEREQYGGKEIVEKLRDAIGDSKKVSEILSKAGFVGIEYPAQYRSGGRSDGAMNHVIFNEKDIKIVNKTNIEDGRVELSVVKDPKEIERGTRYEEMARGYETSSRNTERRNREYAEAVARGDTKKVEQKVKAAAKAAMPDTKVVDENGEMIVMSHNTDGEFWEFDRNKIGTGQGQAFLGMGFNFSRGGNSTYGKNEMRAYLDAKNPLESDGHKLKRADVESVLRKLDEGESDTIVAEFAGTYAPYGSREYESALRKVAKDLVDGYDDLGIYGSISVVGGKANETIEAFKALGFDSSIERDSEGRIRNAVVFDSNQIKSADPVTYDDNGNVIPLSERFNTKKQDIRYRLGDEKKPTFYSNAEKAVEGIKQNKATAEQWKAMLTKAGGIKAGEDKWMGLSQWLDENKGKSLTKDEVLQFVKDNGIQMEETNYSEGSEGAEKLEELTKEFNELVKSKGSVTEAFNEMGRRYGDDFRNGIEIGARNKNGLTLLPIMDMYDEPIPEANNLLLPGGLELINGTRLKYTTGGLKNYREIAFKVPNIEPYQEFDEIHFGPENEGKAVMWVRFGETNTAPRKGYAPTNIMNELEKKYGNSDAYGKMSDEDAAKRFFANYIERGEHANMDVSRMEMEQALGKERMGKVYPLFEEMVDNIAKGERVLVIDEIQSNRHQKGREKGYVNRKEAINQIEELKAKFDDVLKERKDKLDQIAKRTGITDEGDLDYYIIKNQHEKDVEELFNLDEIAGTYQDKIESLESVAEGDYSGGEVPDAPFEKNWHEVAMKRMLRLAAEEGFDKVAWTTGKQQAERYGIGRVVKGIRASDWQDDFLGWKDVKTIDAPFQNDNELQLVVDRNGKIVADINDNYDGRDLSELFRKEIADKLMGDGKVELEDAALRIGGEGMKGFYDQMLPRFMDKYGKKWGVKTGTVELPNVEEAGRTMHSIDVTPEMKESVMQGQPLFRLSDSRFSDDKEFEQAVKEYNDTLRMNERRANRQGADYYPTPAPLALVASRLLHAEKGMDVLDIGSGSGMLHKYIKEGNVTAVEASPELAEANRKNTDANVVTGDFMEIEDGKKYDRIITNPPYGQKGAEAFRHATKGYESLADGGRMVAILPMGRNADRLYNEFVEKVKADGGRVTADVELPSCTFYKAGVHGSRTRMIVVDKNAEGETEKVNLGGITTNQGLYEAIYKMDVGLDGKVNGVDMSDASHRIGFSRPRGEGHMERVTEGVEKANRQLGGNAKVVREVDLGKDVPKNAQAWYDPNTGEVNVVAERVNGAEDASRAVWHEEIGHKAMSELLGDRYNEWLDDVHKLLDSEHADAMQRLREKYAKELEGKSKEAQNRLLADEWIAELAERGEKDLSTWQKVKGMFRNWLWKHFGVMLGDGDIDYMLHKALAERRKGYRSKAMMSIAERRRAEEGNAMAEQSRRYRLLDEENRAEAKTRARDLLEAERDELNDKKTQMEDALNRALTVRRGDPSAENLAMSPKQRRELAASIERLEKRIDALNDSLAETDLTDPERVVNRAWDHVGLATEAEMLMQKAESLMKTKDILRDAGVASVESLTPEQRKEYDRYLWNGKIADARLTAMRDARPERPFEGSIDDNLGREPQYDDFRHPDLDRDDLSERDRDYLERQANDNYSRAKAEWNRKKERLIEQLDDYEAECDDWRMRQRDYMREIVDAEKKLRADWQTDYWSAMENNQEADALLHVADMTGIPLTSKHDVQTYLRELRYEHVRRQQHAEGEDYKFIKEIESMVDKAVGTGSLANKVRKHGDRKQVMRDLIDMMEGTKEVTEEMKPIVKKIQQWFDDMFEWQVASGLVYAPWKYRQGYVPHLWNIDASRPDADAAAKIEKAGGLVPTRMNSPFMNERFYDTYEEGIQHGLVPKHESIIDLIKEYSKEVNKAVSNRQALDILRFVKAPIETEMWVEKEGGGKEKVKQTQWLPIVIDAGEVPPKGVQYNAYKNSAFYKDGTPQFLILSPRYVKGTERNIYSMFGEQGYVSSKDAADSGLEKALGTADKLGQTVKQTNLSFSAFHAIALTEHMLGASKNPLRSTKRAIYDSLIESVITGKTLRQRQADVAEDAMSHFVKMGNSYDFDKSMDVLTKLADVINNPDNPEWKKFQQAKTDKERAKAAKSLIRTVFGSPLKLVKMLKKGNDFILWDMLHDGYKLSVWDMRSKYLRKQAEKKGWSDAELNRRLDDLGQTINDMFGGQHWELLNASPRTMRNLRLAFLSPDWNASWLRLWGRMFGMGKLRNDNFFRGLKNEEGNWQSPISGKAIQKAWKENHAQYLSMTVMGMSALMAFVGYSLMNLAMRKKDIEEELAKAEEMRKKDPNYKSPYEEEGVTPITWENFLGRANEWMLSPWNSLNDPGKGTYVYIGKDESGRGRYLRPGKQMRELFELFLDEKDHLDLGAWYKAGLRKMNPLVGVGHEMMTGYSTSGWENKELTQTYGAERELNRLKYVVLHTMLPMSIIDPVEKGDTDKMWWRMAYPVSKGMGWYKGRELLEDAIRNDDDQMVNRVRRAYVLNGMSADFESAYSKALGTIRKEKAKEEGYDDKTPSELFEMAAKSNDPKMREKLLEKAKEQIETTGMSEGKTAREAMAEYQQKTAKEGNYLVHCTAQDMEYDTHMKIFMKKAEEDGSVVATFRKMGGTIPKKTQVKKGKKVVDSRIEWKGKDGYTNADCEKFYKEHEDELIAYYRMNMFREGYNARIKEMKDLKGKEADAKMKEIREYRDKWMQYASEYLDTTTWKVKKHKK